MSEWMPYHTLDNTVTDGFEALITDINSYGKRYFAIAQWASGSWYQFDPEQDCYSVETMDFKGLWMPLPEVPEVPK